MPTLDSTAKAAIASASFAPAWYLYLDISGDPLRVTTFGANTTFSSTGDADLDGNTFVAFGGSLIDVSDVSNSEGGSDTLTITLSGIVTIDTSIIADIANKALWQGRLCRVWFQVYDENGVTKQGAVVSHYTGYMSSVTFMAEPESQTIQVIVENYLAYTTQASYRSYLNQKDYDSADVSAAATIAASNGLRQGGSGASGPPVNYGGGGGGGDGGIGHTNVRFN